MSAHTVYSDQIYHGLPKYPDNLRGLTAIITGANGISGQHMLKVLVNSPQRWSRIYCLSRRPPAFEGKLPDHVTHIPSDFLDEPRNITKTLIESGVKADHVFFFSYVQVKAEPGESIWANAKGLAEVNITLLGVYQATTDHAPDRSQKLRAGLFFFAMSELHVDQFRLHLGPTKVPQEESDPRVLLEPNFYYDQEDCLFSYCKKNDIGWNVVRPSWILGAVPDAAMNLCYALGIYATVCKHLGQPLDFPTSLESWQSVQAQSSAMLNAYLQEWCVLTDGAKNEAFNATDDAPSSWGKIWVDLASWYGIDYKTPNEEDSYHQMKSAHDPPPRGFGPPATFRVKFSFVEWAKRPEVQQAWSELGFKHDLVNHKLDDVDRLFGTPDMAMCAPYSSFLGMMKARKLGWNGCVDSSESFLHVLHDFERLKMLPPLLEKGSGAGNPKSECA